MPTSLNHARILTLTDLSLGVLILGTKDHGRGKDGGCGLVDGSMKPEYPKC